MSNHTFVDPLAPLLESLKKALNVDECVFANYTLLYIDPSHWIDAKKLSQVLKWSSHNIQADQQALVSDRQWLH